MSLVHVFGVFAALVVAVYIISYVLHHVVWRLGQTTKVRVYDGKLISAVSGDQGASLVYQEMYQQQVYLQNGISLAGVEQPVIVDAGVNIGIFSRFCAEKFPTATVFGAEPIPDIADMARQNTDAYRDRVRISTVALGKTAGEFTIEYRPTLSSASTMHPDEVASAASKDVIDWIRGLILDGVRGGKYPAVPLKQICFFMGVPYLRVVMTIWITPLLILAAAWYTAGSIPKRNIKCRVVTMEQLLAEQHAPKSGPIHLVKVDVEGAEMDVLEGISDALWSRIQQLVVEVHNIDGRVEKVRRLLASKGFSKVVSEKEEWEVHRLLDITSLFAKK